MTALSCGCPIGPGRTITDPARHEEWHALVVEQGGPAGDVSAVTLQAERGFLTGTPNETIFDAKARRSGKRSSGAQRRAAHG